MKFYYRNPKTEDLMIFDSEENELFIVEKIKEVRAFIEKDLLYPRKSTDIDRANEPKYEDDRVVKKYQRRGHRAVITPEMIETIKQQKKEGISGYKIAKELGISASSVYKQQ